MTWLDQQRHLYGSDTDAGRVASDRAGGPDGLEPQGVSALPGAHPSREIMLPLSTWIPILDGDPSAAAMYERHYSSARTLRRRRESGAKLFLGPGRKLVLATPCRRALFAWRLAMLRDDGQVGVECAVFRNEGAGLSSDLIRAADKIADARWPGQRHFTYVNPRAVANSNAGRCFRRAGWHYEYARDAHGQKRRKVSSRGLFIMFRVAPLRSRPDRAQRLLSTERGA